MTRGVFTIKTKLTYCFFFVLFCFFEFVVEIRDLYMESYRMLRGLNLGRFWRDVVPDPDIIQLSDDDLVIREAEDAGSACSYWSNNGPASPVRSSETRTAASKDRVSRTAMVVEPLGHDGVTAVVDDQDIFARPLDSVDKVNSCPDDEGAVPHQTKVDPPEDPPPPTPPPSSLAGHKSCAGVIELLKSSQSAEEDSECSVGGVYENGLDRVAPGAMLASASLFGPTKNASGGGGGGGDHCEPNFKNCLNLAPATAAGSAPVTNGSTCPLTVVDMDEASGCLPTLGANDNGETLEAISPDAAAAALALAIGGPCDRRQIVLDDSMDAGECASSQQSAPMLTSDSVELFKQVEPSVEKKIPTAKYKLPTPIMKPDSARAVNYWESQRRAALPKASVNGSAKPARRKDDVELNIDAGDMNVFHLGRELGAHDALGQRVLQVSLMILLRLFAFVTNFIIESPFLFYFLFLLHRC